MYDYCGTFVYNYVIIILLCFMIIEVNFNLFLCLSVNTLQKLLSFYENIGKKLKVAVFTLDLQSLPDRLFIILQNLTPPSKHV